MSLETMASGLTDTRPGSRPGTTTLRERMTDMQEVEPTYEDVNQFCGRVPCSRERYGNTGVCKPHYSHLLRYGEARPLADRALRWPERFWAKVDVSGDCWEWLASRQPSGYGQIHHRGTMLYAHRVSLELDGVAVPEGMVVDHICHNRGCVNPAHLRVVSNSGNGQNREGLNANNTSGFRGVYRQSGGYGWCARAVVGGATHHIGLYETREKAGAAVARWREENMPYSGDRSQQEMKVVA